MSSIQEKIYSFRSACTEQEARQFDQIRLPLESERCAMRKARDLYGFYARVRHLGQELEGTKRALFFDLLNNCRGKKIHRIGAPPIPLDFDPLFACMGKEKTAVELPERVNPWDDAAVNEAALALDALSYEGTGHSFGPAVYRAIVGCNSSVCFIVREEEMGSIVGAVLGTVVKTHGASVLNFWLAARKANYPGHHFLQNFSHYLDDVARDSSVRFVTLSVDASNKAIDIYTALGFKTVETIYNKYSQSESHFMVKRIGDHDSLSPFSEEITKATTKQATEILGKGNSLIAAARFFFTCKLNAILYG